MCQKSREMAKCEIRTEKKIYINFKSQPVKMRAGTLFRAPTWHKTNPQTNAQNVNILPKKERFFPLFHPLPKASLGFFRGSWRGCLFIFPSPRPSWCEAFEVQQQGEVLLYFRYNRFISRPIQAF